MASYLSPLTLGPAVSYFVNSNLVREGLAILFTNSVFISQEQLGKTYPSHLTMSCHRNHGPQTFLIIKPTLQHFDWLKSALDYAAIINHLICCIVHRRINTQNMTAISWLPSGISYGFLHGREKKQQFSTWVLKVNLGAWELAGWLRACAALLEDLSWQLTSYITSGSGVTWQSLLAESTRHAHGKHGGKTLIHIKIYKIWKVNLNCYIALHLNKSLLCSKITQPF